MSPSNPASENDARKSIRLALKVPMTILGRDRKGEEFALKVETINVSPHGFSIELPCRCVGSGDDVFISVATKFNARARIRWLEDEDCGDLNKLIQCGVELVEPYSNWVLMD